MLNLYPQLDVGSPGEDDNRICYGVVVACVSLLLFCVLIASVSVAKACAITVVIVVFFAFVGWLTPARARAPRDSSGMSGQRDAAMTTVEVRRCSCGLADAAPPAFAYGDGGKRGSCVLCAVCLEDVQGGEMVRQLPTCRHLFHVECIDTWLRSHRTCPLCRCELPPPQRDTAKTSPAAAVESSSADALPPV